MQPNKPTFNSTLSTSTIYSSPTTHTKTQYESQHPREHSQIPTTHHDITNNFALLRFTPVCALRRIPRQVSNIQSGGGSPASRARIYKSHRFILASWQTITLKQCRVSSRGNVALRFNARFIKVVVGMASEELGVAALRKASESRGMKWSKAMRRQGMSQRRILERCLHVVWDWLHPFLYPSCQGWMKERNENFRCIFRHTTVVIVFWCVAPFCFEMKWKAKARMKICEGSQGRTWSRKEKLEIGVLQDRLTFLL